MTPGGGRVGVLLPRDLPAQQMVTFAQRSEDLGFDELWIVEDLGFRGGIAQAATVLAATSSIAVGIGILPAGVRNVAFLAMEIATLAQLHAGRLIVGVGHGMPEWMRQTGAWSHRPLALLTEYAEALSALLRGRAVRPGRFVRAEGLILSERPDVVPPIVLGVRGPRSLLAAGQISDGVVLAEPAAPEYVAESLAFVRQRRISPVDPLVITYDLAVVAEDTATAHDMVRPHLAVVGEPDWRPHISPLEFAADLETLRAQCPDGREFAARLPGAWISALTLAGTADQVRRSIDARHGAGASTVVLAPVGVEPLEGVRSLARVLAQ